MIRGTFSVFCRQISLFIDLFPQKTRISVYFITYLTFVSNIYGFNTARTDNPNFRNTEKYKVRFKSNTQNKFN